MSDIEATAEQNSALVNLFSQVTRKPRPNYDYSVIPSRVQEQSDEEEAVVEPKKKKKPKSGLRGKRKREAAEAAAAANKVINGDLNTEEPADQDSVVKSLQEAKSNEALEIQKRDRMAQVKHEDQKERMVDPETEDRTVYVGNLATSYKKKDLKQLFSQFGKVETVRFRCAARPDMKTTKKETVIKHKFHEDRNSFAAYVRFSTKEEAVAASKLNGKELEGHTIRVDLALAAKSHDNKKAVFLGNLDFKVQEDDVRKLFAKCGEIENIRLIRDSATGIGKGFGYVNFVNTESVDLALRLINQEVCGRKVRVTRAVRKAKPGKLIASNTEKKNKWQKGVKNTNYKNKTGSKSQTPTSGSKSQTPTKRPKGFKKTKKETKSFQGISTTTEKPKKSRVNKTEKRNKILAEKLSA